MKLYCIVALSLVLTGCVATYRDFPVAALEHKPEPGQCGVLHYNVKKFDILDMGGYSKLQDLFKNADMCKKMVSTDTSPEKGLYVEVQAKWKPMTFPALAFGYISVSTLTFFPAWSTKDGYLVKYNLYVDGNKKETFNYEITRKAGLWIGLIPFSWLNLMTYDEEQAFEATAYQFAHDARSYLSSPGL